MGFGVNTTMYELDTIDLRILDLLQQQGRLTMTELERASAFHFSLFPTGETAGAAGGDYGLLRRASIRRRWGGSLLVFVEITLTEKFEQIFKKVRDALAHVPRCKSAI